MDSASVSVYRFVPVVFTHSLSMKLDNGNYLLWRQQVSAVIRCHKLQDFISDMVIRPLMFLTEADRAWNKLVNQEFLNWEQQEQLLFLWLLSSMTELMLTWMRNIASSLENSTLILLHRLRPRLINLKFNYRTLKINLCPLNLCP